MMPNAEQAQAMVGPISIDGVGASTLTPEQYWEQADRKRREACDWAAKRLTA